MTQVFEEILTSRIAEVEEVVATTPFFFFLFFTLGSQTEGT